jgi:DNA-binding SARP family transcriptional activator/predicted negative regulator of RcsB-dependent stress response
MRIAKRVQMLSIHLLGKPHVERDGVPVPGPRGHKAWGLLAYLLRAERPASRDHVVSLLFSEADDPAAALRWNLSELRTLLGDRQAIEGDPLRLSLPPATFIDVETIARGSWAEALRVPELERDLLEGINFSSSPAFEMWLIVERRHFVGTAEGVLREAALARLSSGDAAVAAELAARLVALNPLDENFQSLLVRCLATAGRETEAVRQVDRATELFRRELGLDPSPALAAAASTVGASQTAAPVTGRAAARAQLEAGQAAIAAGALEAGLDCLRRAVVEAEATDDLELQANALLALGGALVHAARGRDEEAAPALHRALAIATRANLGGFAAAAVRELGYIEFLRGRYERARAWIKQAMKLADDEEERGRVHCLLGSVLTDTAHYESAIEELQTAVDLSDRCGDVKQAAYALAMLGRACLLRSELDRAGEALDRSLEITRRETWTAFLAWPEALRGDVDFAAGETDLAAERYEYAFTLGCQLGDPCWEGIAARGLGVVAAARGDIERAVDWLSDAQRRCTRLPDGYLWVEAYALDALCDVAVEHDLRGSGAWIDELSSLAGRTGMRELTARAYFHRARLGDEAAAEVAPVLAGKIDNPALLARG